MKEIQMNARRVRFLLYFSAILLILAAGVLIWQIRFASVPDTSIAVTASPVISTDDSPRNPVDFIREHVGMVVSGDSVTVTGTYWFRINDRRGDRLPILYPFPVDDSHEYPARITVLDTDGHPIEFAEDPSSSSIHFAMDLTREPEFTVIYTQHITGSDARYILTTTAAWERPLEYAAFTVSLPDAFELRSLSYKYDSMEVDHGRHIYSFSRENFMPVHDLVVSWID